MWGKFWHLPLGHGPCIHQAPGMSSVDIWTKRNSQFIWISMRTLFPPSTFEIEEMNGFPQFISPASCLSNPLCRFSFWSQGHAFLIRQRISPQSRETLALQEAWLPAKKPLIFFRLWADLMFYANPAERMKSLVWASWPIRTHPRSDWSLSNSSIHAVRSQSRYGLLLIKFQSLNQKFIVNLASGGVFSHQDRRKKKIYLLSILETNWKNKHSRN